MEKVLQSVHSERMKQLVEFTAGSFDTRYPSPFGSSVYHSESGELISQAYDTVMRECNPINHAEILAIRDASRSLQSVSLSGCILYSTCEPCPMCISACIHAELDVVVFGATILDDADRYWPQASDVLPHELVSRVRIGTKCLLIPNVEQELCQKLFIRCEELRIENKLELPPHR